MSVELVKVRRRKKRASPSLPPAKIKNKIKERIKIVKKIPEKNQKKIKISGAGEYCGKREGEGCRGEGSSPSPCEKIKKCIKKELLKRFNK